LEAEAQINTSTFVSTVVRFSGIYGAERGRLLRQVQEGCVDITQAAQWTNRIHADDCARVLAHLLCRWQRGETVAPCYVATDDCPVQAGEVWQWLAAQLAVRDPLLDVDWHSAVASGKRCSNALLRREGFVFSSPDYRAGYQSLLGKTV
jgi:dTDP-4-dehydrorhamnose reductase